MSETVKQENQNPAQEPEKTFTQSELNAIVADRLSRERGKYSDYEELKTKAAQFDAAEEARKTELQKATIRKINRAGGTAAIVRSVDDVRRILETA